MYDCPSDKRNNEKAEIHRVHFTKHRLWHGHRLNITSSEPGAALHKLKLHWSASANRAIALSRQRRKVEEHFVACTLSGDHAGTRVEIEPAHHSLGDRQTVCTQRWCTLSPFLLGDANPPYLRGGVRFVAVISTTFHQDT